MRRSRSARFDTGLCTYVRGGAGLVQELRPRLSLNEDRYGWVPGILVRPELYDDDRDGPVPPIGIVVSVDGDNLTVLWTSAGLSIREAVAAWHHRGQRP